MEGRKVSIGGSKVSISQVIVSIGEMTTFDLLTAPKNRRGQ
jgi:hypothetical protein